MEANFAFYCEWLKQNGEIKDWFYEPETFWFEKIKRGVRSYKPDFLMIENNDSRKFKEVKGWMDARSKTKLNRMRIYHPDVDISVFGPKEYKELKFKLSGIIPGWIY